MDFADIMTLAMEGLKVTMLLSAPILLTALVVGLLVGMVQAATQIQEMTLSFIPKLLAMGAVGLITGPWMLQMMVDYTTALYEAIPALVMG